MTYLLGVFRLHPPVDEIHEEPVRADHTECAVAGARETHSYLNERLEQTVKLALLGDLSSRIEQFRKAITVGDRFHQRTIPCFVVCLDRGSVRRDLPDISQPGRVCRAQTLSTSAECPPSTITVSVGIPGVLATTHLSLVALGPNVLRFWGGWQGSQVQPLATVCGARGFRLRVLVVDDHPVVREGLRALLTSQDDIEVAGEAASGASAIRRAGYDSPDVVVMDVRLPDMSGVAACRTIVERFPDIKVLMLSSHVDEETVHEAILAGASGYLVKRIDGDRIVDAVRSVSDGASVIDPAATAKLFNQIRGQSVGDPVFSQLSEREVRILELIADGLTNREIADRVFLAEKTVKNYISRLLAKLGLRNRNEAAAYMARRIADREAKYPPEDWADE